MKIVFYSPLSLRNGGGAEQWQLAVAPKLQELYGHQVSIVTATGGGRNLSRKVIQERLRGVAYHELPTTILPGGVVWLNHAARQQLADLLKDADAIHYVFGFIGQDWLLSRLKPVRARLLAGFHAPILTHSRLHNLYVQTISRYLTLPRCDNFLVFNDAQAALLKKWCNRIPTISIAGGVDLERFAVPKRAQKQDALRFVYVGRFEYEKGTDILVAAIQRFIAAAPQTAVHFYLVGAGSYYPLVKQLAERFPHQVHLHPFTADVRPFLVAAQVAVLPSRQETFGLAMIEALAMGLPVLASGADGPRRILQPERTGWIIDPINPEKLAAGFKHVYDIWQKDARWERWTAATRATAEGYSPDVIARRIDQIINV